MTCMPSLSETSKSLKTNKEEVLRNLFSVGESCSDVSPFSLFVVVVGLVWFLGGRGLCLVWVFFVFQAQIAHIHTTKGFNGYSAISVGC